MLVLIAWRQWRKASDRQAERRVPLEAAGGTSAAPVASLEDETESSSSRQGDEMSSSNSSSGDETPPTPPVLDEADVEAEVDPVTLSPSDSTQ